MFWLRILSAPLILTLALQGQAPALIDRDALFSSPGITNPQLSPDGRYVAFLAPWRDTYNVWVKKIADPMTSARLITAETRRPVSNFIWTRDSRYVGVVRDTNGDENFNVFLTDVSARPAAGADAPPAYDRTALKGARIEIIAAPKHDPDALVISVNDRDRNWPDLYKLKLTSGQKTLLRKNTDNVTRWVFDLSGELRLATRSAPDGDQEILRVEPDSLTKIYSCTVFEICSPARFNKDGSRVYVVTNGGDADLSGLALLDPLTGKLEAVESDPLKKVDLASAFFADDTENLVETNYVDDRTRHYFRDTVVEADFHWLESKIPGREISIVSDSADEGVWLVGATSDLEPGETYAFDRKAHRLLPQFRVRENIPRSALAPMRAVHYASSDGLDIPAYLTLPLGIPAKGLPALVIPHRGPWERDIWGYNPVAQFFANRGYAVLMPNYRGSAGYGKKYVKAGDGQWARLMQDDITWGVKYLTSQGIADAARVGIVGSEYGGYAVLAGAVFTPGLYKAGVDMEGPSNLSTMLGVIPAYWEGGRKLMYARVADPGTPAGVAWLKERSPLYSVDKITTPLLIVQGANDPQAARGETEQIVASLRDRHTPVRYLLAPDEGHGFQKPVNNLAVFEAAEKFLSQYLGGRYQEPGLPAVAARLAELVVDPDRIALRKDIDPHTVELPKPETGFKTGTTRYQTRVLSGGQETTFIKTLEIKQESGSWWVTETSSLPAGKTSETAILENGTLAVRKHMLTEGPLRISLDFANGKAIGSVVSNGRTQTISAEIPGELFADSAAASQSIAALPLAEGYTTRFLNFDVGRQNVSVWNLRVTGSEKVTVPTGNPDAFRVEITSAAGGTDVWTLWVSKDTRQPVKVVRILAAMNGATLTTEMLP